VTARAAWITIGNHRGFVLNKQMEVDTLPAKNDALPHIFCRAWRQPLQVKTEILGDTVWRLARWR
jgi:hypothetical protein